MIKKNVFKLMDRLKIVREPINRNDRYGALYRSWGFVFTNLLKGAYYEFGLYKADTFIDSWHIYQQYVRWAKDQLSSPEEWRRETIREYAAYTHEFIGFDSFEGIPENNEQNKFFVKGTYAYSLQNVQKKCLQAGMPCRLTKGFFNEINPATITPMPKAVIANIDCDLYQSAKDALNLLKDKFQQGTILLMDDYNCFASANGEGERRVLKEFCQSDHRYDFEPWFPYHHVGQAFIIHVKGE